MKVAFITRLNLYTIPGGDTVQVDQTARNLIDMGIKVDILRSVDTILYENYDVLHFFGILRPGDIIYHSKLANKPFVVSTIYCNFDEYYEYKRKVNGSFFPALSSDSLEYIKTIARWMVGKDHRPNINYLLYGQHKSIFKVLKTANLILPNSQSELNRLKKNYTSDIKSLVVTNGINPEKFILDTSIKKDDKLIICAARIESRKNQLSLIKALNNTVYKLVIIGAPSGNNTVYYKQCVAMAGPNVTFTGPLPLNELLKYYQMAKVHVLPSWFETTGLSSLEAAIMGCNIVITDKGDTVEYFGDDAFYCDPANIESIKAAVDKASEATFNKDFYDRMIANHTWKKAAEQTLEAYNLAIAN